MFSIKIFPKIVVFLLWIMRKETKGTSKIQVITKLLAIAEKNREKL